MFKRKLEVGVVKVKKDKDATEAVPTLTFEEKSHIVEKTIRKLMVSAAWCAVAYVAMDTVRKIAVEAAKAE